MGNHLTNNRLTNYLFSSSTNQLHHQFNLGEQEPSATDVEPNPMDVGFLSRSAYRKRGLTLPVGQGRLHEEEAVKKKAKVIKLDTAKYLHQKLFVEGKKSDVTIQAVGHEWHLHKIYLEQCDYFRCLFSGNWVDSAQNLFNLTIEDEQITFDGLNTVFASLYQNEINFELKNLGGILASATLFNLEVCIDRCEELMIQSINGENVIEYFEWSQCYGCLKSKQKCILFLTRLFWKLAQNDEFLEKVNYELLVLIFTQKQMCVADAERDLYNAIKRWIFINETKKMGRSFQEIQKYFIGRPDREYDKYKELLQNIRFQYLITSSKSFKLLKMEHIVGEEVLNRILHDQWITLLRNEEERLVLDDHISEDTFYTHCRRVGRVMSEDKNWRWAGLDHGLDLVMSCRFGMISMCRNVTNDPTNQLLSMRREYKFHYRLLILSERGEIVADSGIKSTKLDSNQKQFVVSYPAEIKEPSIHLFYLNHVPGMAAHEYWSDPNENNAEGKEKSDENEAQKNEGNEEQEPKATTPEVEAVPERQEQENGFVGFPPND